MRVALRRGRKEDAGRVLDLLQQAELPTDGVPEALEGFWLAEVEGAVAGVVGVERHGQYGLLRSAVVSAGLRGTGVGAALVERAVDEARRAGMSALYLLTTTADGYFPRFGFREVERHTVPDAVQRSREFEQICPASAVAMVLDLEE